MVKELDITKIFPEGKWAAKDEFLIACPYCGDKPGHHHCFVNLKKEVFHCFFCGEKGPLRRLLREKAGLAATAGARFSPQPAQPEVKVDMTDFGQFDMIPFPRHGDFDQLSIGAKAWQYLVNRGITEPEIIMYKMRYSKIGRYARRVIVPIIEAGKVVCFSARSFANVEPKYLFPHKGETILSASDSIFNYEALMRGTGMEQTVVITEGIFDCIAVERLGIEPNVICISTLSKRISDVQARKLVAVRNNRKFVIMFDSVAKDHRIWGDIKQAAKKLSEFAPDVKVAIAELGEADPDQASPIAVLDALRTAEPFDTGMEMRAASARPRKKINYPEERRV